MKNGYRVVDIDVHTNESWYPYERNLEEPYRSLTTHVTPKEGEIARSATTIEIGNKVLQRRSPDNPSLVARHSLRVLPRHPNLVAAHAPRSNPDVYETYLEAMDIEGIDVALLVPQNVRHLTQVDGLDPKHALALCRVANDFSAEWAHAAPDRMKFWAWLPRQDARLAAEEARRCVEELGAVGVAMSQIPVDDHVLSDEFFEPLWTEVERLGMPLGLHILGLSGHHGLRANVAERYQGHRRAEIISSVTTTGGFSAYACLAELILSGALEEHPKLRPVIMEAAAGWLPWILWLMDSKYEMYGPDLDYQLSMKPSDYFRRQCYVSPDWDEDTMKYVIDYAGSENLLFSIDYPHHDGGFPEGTNDFLALPGLTAEAKRKILWDNAANLFGLS